MDPEVLSEAKDFVSGWIDKAGADGSGVNYEVSQATVVTMDWCVDGMQRCKREHGSSIWSFLALCYGGRFLI